MKRIIFLCLFSFSSYLSHSQEYRVNLIVHVIQDVDGGLLGASPESVRAILCRFSDDLKDLEISFIWDESINYIDDATVYHDGVLKSDVARFDQPDGLNVYFFGPEEKGGTGDDRIKIGTGVREGLNIQETALITHEMGHVLGLFHVNNDPKNFMCDSCGLTQWERFNLTQKNTMRAALVSKGLHTDAPGITLCCHNPDERLINLQSTGLFGDTWVTVASYNDEICEPVWEWQTTPTGIIFGTSIQTHFVWWTNPRQQVTMRARVTNYCGNTSPWKEVIVKGN